ncbi:MAG: sigma-54-dependent Fis family transcriptional regulator, partial [Deltaproteobacteria bacterium]|nr:sigma-54-dependent Fis family transcriptional regulator [Deltaproteobacteria bacterium]
MKKVMVVDDDEKAVQDIAEILENEGYTVATFTSAIHAIKTLEAVQDIDLILTDIRMPSVDGAEVLKAAQKSKRQIPVIVFSGFGDVETAVNMMKAGASDFLCKPVSGKELAVRIKKVLEKKDLSDEVESLRRRLESAESTYAIVGKSKKMQEVYELINAVAKTDATVVIRGETGTGKELVAKAIHEASHRRDNPFVGISCTALQHTLLESEFFGHEKGSFTGAHALKIGKLESADAGTVFLDEVGDTH